MNEEDLRALVNAGLMTHQQAFEMMNKVGTYFDLSCIPITITWFYLECIKRVRLHDILNYRCVRLDQTCPS